MTANVARETVEQVPLANLVVHEVNPRKDVGDLTELAASIKEHGVQEPLIAVRQNGHVAVVAGSRRLAAAKKAGLDAAPVIIRDLPAEDLAAIALIENLQRRDLSPLEEARGYRAWLDLTKKTQAELAKSVGKAPSTIANALRLLEAPAPVLKAIESGKLTAAGARVALSVPTDALPLLDLARAHTVDDLEEQARAAQRSHKAYAKLAKAVEEARAAGKVVTWRTPWRETDEDRTIWLDGAEYSLEQLFGKSGPKFRGILGSHQRAAHAAVCDCDAVAIQGHRGELELCCISETGYKKLLARDRASMAAASPQKKKRIQTAKAKEARLRRVVAQSVKEATKAFEGRSLVGWRGENIARKVDDSLLRGGLAGEPARIALFGFLAKFSDARGPMWKLELWKKIQTAPLAAVKQRVAQYALAQGLSEISRASGYGDKYGNTKKIRELVNAHYAPRKAKKAAKRG